MNYLSDVPTARLLLAMALVAALPLKSNSQIAFERSGSTDFRLNATQIVVDPSDFPGVQRVANIFADDINRVTGQKPEVANAVSARRKR